MLPLLDALYCLYDIYIDLVRRKDRISFFVRMEMLNVLYILEALRHNNIMPKHSAQFPIEISEK